LLAFQCKIVLEGALRDLAFEVRRTLKCRNTTRRSVEMNVFYVPAGHVTDPLFVGLFFSRFSKPNARATAVFIDELDAGLPPRHGGSLSAPSGPYLTGSTRPTHEG